MDKSIKDERPAAENDSPSPASGPESRKGTLSRLRKRDRHRKELTEALREKYLQCAAIVDNLKDGVFVETVRGRILDVNSAACRMLGYSREELLEMTVGDLVPPEVAASLPAKIQALTVREGVYVETVNVRKDGTRIPVEVSNTRGRFHARAKVTDRISPGTVWVRDGWPGLNVLTDCTAILPEAALGAFPFSVGQSHFGARVEVAPI